MGQLWCYICMGLCRDQPIRQNVTRLSNCLLVFICLLAHGILIRDFRDSRADVSDISGKILYCHMQVLLFIKTKHSEEEMRKMVLRKILWANIQTNAFQSPAILNQGLDWSCFCSNFSLLTNQQGFPFSSKFAAKKQSLFAQASPLQFLLSQTTRIITVSALFIYKSITVSFSFPRKQRKSWPKNTCLQNNPSQLKIW